MPVIVLIAAIGLIGGVLSGLFGMGGGLLPKLNVTGSNPVSRSNPPRLRA